MGKYKRVNIDDKHLETAQRIAESKNLTLAQYLDYLINKAIVQDANAMKPQLFVWRGR